MTGLLGLTAVCLTTALGLPFVVVTAMQDNAAPWEMFKCLMKRDGTAMRQFINHPLMEHWFTQNYDLLPSAGERIATR